MIPGLTLEEDFISPELENSLILEIDKQEWNNTLSRRTMHFGYEYNYKSKHCEEAKNFTFHINKLKEGLSEKFSFDFNQCIVNEYTKKQSISAHTDSSIFGEKIVSISLNEDCEMIFKNKSEPCEVFTKLLRRRSLLLMEGEARHNYTHEIPKKLTYNKEGLKIKKSPDYRRISLTFRRYE